MNQPFHALVSRFEEEVRRQASQEERDAGVQLLVDVSGLNASLQRQRRAAEQNLLELLEGRLNSQQLLQSCAAWGRSGGGGYMSPTTRPRMVLTTYRGRRRCSCPWWRHLGGQRAETRPLCGSARPGRSEAEPASSAGGPTTSWQRCLEEQAHVQKDTFKVWLESQRKKIIKKKINSLMNSRICIFKLCNRVQFEGRSGLLCN